MLRKLTFLILRVMGIKKIFSESPINYKKLRKSDQKKPPKSFYKKFTVGELTVDETKIYKIENKRENSKGLVIFIHGGAFVSGPAEHHWKAVEKIVKHSGKKVWLLDYPKAPEFTIEKICDNIDSVFEFAIQTTVLPENTILIGDSVGGNLIMSLTQRLIKKKKEIPGKLILISPVFDASLTNKDIKVIESKDPMLGIEGALSAKKLAAGPLDLTDQMISPLYGSFKGFPKTDIYIGEYDIMCPDAKIGANKMKKEEVKVQVINGEKMPHIFPLLPILPEAKIALDQIINSIRE
jgi:acetyl esterase/lipase